MENFCKTLCKKIILDCPAVRSYGSLEVMAVYFFVFRPIYYSFQRDAEASSLKKSMKDTLAKCTVFSSKCSTLPTYVDYVGVMCYVCSVHFKVKYFI